MNILRPMNFGIMLCCFVLSFQGIAWAKKAEHVSIKLTPDQQNITVKNTGNRSVVSGNGKVKVDVTRKQAGSRCTKIPFIRLVEGTDPLSMDFLAFETVGSKPKGLCNFTKNLYVQPFTDDELISQCTSVTPRRTVRKSGLVSFWKTRPQEQSYVTDGTRRECKTVKENCRPVQPIDLHPGEVKCDEVERCSDVPFGHWQQCDKICGGKRESDHRVNFVANVRCENLAGSLPPLPSACNMMGWWKMSTGVASLDGEWQFTKKSASQKNMGIYSAKGPATKRSGVVHFGSGSGNATINVNKNFNWTLTGINRITCSGRIKDSCKIIAGMCQGIGPNAPQYPFELEKSNGPTNIATNPSPVGTPSSPNSTYKPRTAPKNPAFIPGPKLPKKPRW